MCVTLLNVLKSYLSENQFLSVDIFIIIPLAFFIPATGPYKYLTKHHPTDSLISYPVISSILSQTVIAFVFQLSAHFLVENMIKDYVNFCLPDEDNCEILACPDNTAIFLMSNMQYLVTAIAFSISKPFKSPIYTNIYLTLFMLFGLVYSCVIILWQKDFISHLLQLYNFENPHDSFWDERRKGYDEKALREEEEEDRLVILPEERFKFQDNQIKYYIQGLVLIYFAVAYVFERLIVPATTSIWNARKIEKLRELKKRESEKALTMQQLFQLSE